MPVPTISSGALRKMVSAAAEAGLPPAKFLAELGLDPRVVDDPDGRIPIDTLHAAWELVFDRIPAARGPVTADRYTPGDYGLVGFVAMNSATLGEALGHVVRYIGLWTDDP